MEPSLALLLSNWCTPRFLGDNGEQHYSLRLEKIAKLSVKYNTEGWHCWITLQTNEIIVSLTDGTGGNCKGATFNVADTGAEKLIKWCIANFPEMNCN